MVPRKAKYLAGLLAFLLLHGSFLMAQTDSSKPTAPVQTVRPDSARKFAPVATAGPDSTAPRPPQSTAAAKKSDKKQAADTAARKVRSEPSKAAIRSAILPGLGQAYNKKYWKIPIVYGALAVPTATFIYNKNWYDKTREAYSIKYYNDTNKVTPDLPTDGMDSRLVPLSTESTRLYRNEFRKNMDLSILAFLIIWGLQVADAAVDAHLKSFNVSEDLSLKIKPSFYGNGQPIGLGLQLQIGRNGPHKVTSITR